MAIELYIGNRGSGKTFELVRKALQLVYHGLPVYLNFTLDVAPGYAHLVKEWYTFDDFMAIRGANVFMDEAQLWLNSRNWKELPPEVMYRFQFARHHAVHIYGTTQRLQRIDVAIREQIDVVHVCRKIVGNREFDKWGQWRKTKPWGIYTVQDWEQVSLDPNNTETPWENDGIFSYAIGFYTKQIATAYDTSVDVDKTRKSTTKFRDEAKKAGLETDEAKMVDSQMIVENLL